MSIELLKYGVLYLFFGALTKKHFDVSPIWSEYHDPSELKDFDDVPKSWLEKNLFLPMTTNTNPYYAVKKDIDYSGREFVCVLSNLSIGSFELLGYVFLVKGKVNSVSIFINEDIVDIYSSDICSDDNVDSIEDISKHFGVDSIDDNKISYSMVPERIMGICTEGDFFFPVD